MPVMTGRRFALIALLLAFVALVAGCGGGGSKSTPHPRFGIEDLSNTLLTAGELPVTHYSMTQLPGRATPDLVTTGAHYSIAGKLAFSIDVSESSSQPVALAALASGRSGDGTLTGTTSVKLPFGYSGLLIRGTDPTTGKPAVVVSYVQGASVIALSVVPGYAALPESTIIEIARRQNYKYIATTT